MKMVESFVKSRSFPECPKHMKTFGETGMYPHGQAFFIGINSHIPECDLDNLPEWCPEFNEAQMVKGFEDFRDGSANAFFHNAWHYNPLLMSLVAVHPALYFGHLEGLDVWYDVCMKQWERNDLPTTKNYVPLVMDVWDGNMFGCFTLLMIDRFAEAEAWLNAIGFTWTKEGFESMDSMFQSASQAMPGVQVENEIVFTRLMVFLASSKGSIDEEQFTDWMPSPQSLADMERNYIFHRRMGINDVTSLGARVFLKLGRDDDAYELARIAVSPEQKTEKKTTLVTSYSILGQIAAKRGQADEADGHFAKALEEAKLLKLPMLEVMVARDWKKYLLGPNELDSNAAEAIIDAACTKMKKTREQLASVLD
jgi:hypothetical protein